MDTKYKLTIVLQNIGVYVLLLGAAWLTSYMFPASKQLIDDNIGIAIAGIFAVVLNDFFGWKRFVKSVTPPEEPPSDEPTQED